MAEERIPRVVAQVVGEILGGHYYNHTTLNTMLLECGAPGDPPEGNCVVKVTSWLVRAGRDPGVDAFDVLGKVLAHYMDEVTSLPYPRTEADLAKTKQRIHDALARAGLSYHAGGRILGATSSVPTRSLDQLLRARDLRSVEMEFERALKSVLTDPPAALTAACAIVEAVCKVYIADEGLELPGMQTVKPLWKVVQQHIGLDPATLEDNDLKQILVGLSSIVDGLGALRTHGGSAHGRGRKPYSVEPRHARLAIHSAHSLTAFLLETWEHRRKKRS